jgi:hypothetical protein
VPEEHKEAVDILEKRAEKRLLKNKRRELNVGDLVRVSTAALYSGVRREKKESKTSKYVVVKWSEKIYRVKTRIKKDSPDGIRNTPLGRQLQKFQYTLATRPNPCSGRRQVPAQPGSSQQNCRR